MGKTHRLVSKDWAVAQSISAFFVTFGIGERYRRGLDIRYLLVNKYTATAEVCFAGVRKEKASLTIELEYDSVRRVWDATKLRAYFGLDCERWERGSLSRPGLHVFNVANTSQSMLFTSPYLRTFTPCLGLS